jgi:hypothetical protein
VVDLNQVVQVVKVVEPFALDLLDWFKKRHADTGVYPTHEESAAKLRTLIDDGIAGIDAWDAAHPDPVPAKPVARKPRKRRKVKK